MNRIAANPIPYWATAGKTREVFEEAFRDFQEIGFTAVKADVPDGMTRGGVRRLDRRLRPVAVAEPVQLARSTRPSTWPRRWSGRSGSPPTQVALGPGPHDDLLDGACRPGWPNRRSAPASTPAGWPGPSTTAARCAGCCGPRDCGRCTTRTSAASSRPRTRSSGCSTTSARTSSDSGRTPGTCGGPASSRRRSSAATPTGWAASTSRTASPTAGPGSRAGMSYHAGAADQAAVGRARAAAWWTSMRCWPRSRTDYDGDFMIEVDEPSVRRRSWSRTASRSSGRGAASRTG